MQHLGPFRHSEAAIMGLSANVEVARRERTKVKMENCMTELNMIVVVNVRVIVVRCEEGG